MRSTPLLVGASCLLLTVLVACSATDTSRPLSPSSGPNRVELAGGCPGDYHLASDPARASIDRNGDGYICERIHYFDGYKKAYYIDNSAGARGTCPSEFPTPVSAGDEAYWVDQNLNGIICKNTAANEYTDDN